MLAWEIKRMCKEMMRRTFAFFEKGQYDFEKMMIGPFLRIVFISTSISWSDSLSSSSTSLCLLFFFAALLSRAFEAPVFPTCATPSSSAFGFSTFLPPFTLLPASEGIIFLPATGFPSAGASFSFSFSLPLASSTIGFCFAASPMAFSCSSCIRATRSARLFSSAISASRASVSWRFWIAATVRV